MLAVPALSTTSATAAAETRTDTGSNRWSETRSTFPNHHHHPHQQVRKRKAKPHERERKRHQSHHHHPLRRQSTRNYPLQPTLTAVTMASSFPPIPENDTAGNIPDQQLQTANVVIVHVKRPRLYWNIHHHYRRSDCIKNRKVPRRQRRPEVPPCRETLRRRIRTFRLYLAPN